MAYIPKERAKEIRKAIKKAFPEIKFSITVKHSSKLYVSIMKSPYFEDGEYIGYVKVKNKFTEKQNEVIEKIDEIIKNVGNYYNNSDPMTDYFDVAFYYDITVGKWDKPHEKV